MHFIRSQPHTILFAVIVSGLLFMYSHKLASIERWLADRHLLPAWFVWPLLFLFFGADYLVRPVYYVAYHGGAMGDCYWHIRDSLVNYNKLLFEHLYFPTVPIQFLKPLLATSYYDPLGRMFLERVYTLLSLPNRLFALGGCAAMYGLLRQMRLGRGDAYLGVAFLAVSFGFWFWSLQSSAMGTLLPFMLATLYVLSVALETGRSWLFFLSGIMVSLCVCIHASSLFLAIGMTFAVFALARRCEERLVYCAAVLPMSGVFYGLAARAIGTYNPHQLLTRLSYTQTNGRFILDWHAVRVALTDQVSVPAIVLFGLLQTPRSSRIEASIVILMLACVLFLIFCVFTSGDWKLLGSGQSNAAWHVAAISFFISVLGFALRVTWLQYYVAIAPFAAVMFLGLVLKGSEENPSSCQRSVLVVLIVGMLYINGFSSTRVFVGEHVQDHATYRTLTVIHELVQNAPTVYYGHYRDYFHNQERIVTYYRLADKFRNITWRQPIPIQAALQRNHWGRYQILFDGTDYPDLTAATATGLGLEVIHNSSSDLPILYRSHMGHKKGIKEAYKKYFPSDKPTQIS
jgi:hypothetical protein